MGLKHNPQNSIVQQFVPNKGNLLKNECLAKSPTFKIKPLTVTQCHGYKMAAQNESSQSRGVAAQWAGRALAPPIFLKTAAILLKLVNNY